jgi:DNA-binding transcriptional LysR family regulator
MDLSLSKLHQLIAVARCRNISQAAAELNLSQPALSRIIAKIEAWYGFAIFNRSGQGVEPTSAGAQVLDEAALVLQRLQTFEANAALLRGSKSGTLRLGMAPLLASQIAPRFSEDFFNPESKAQLRLMIRPGLELLQALKDDEIELFFYPATHIPPSDEIEISSIGSIQPVCVVRREHPLARRDNLTLAALRSFRWASSVEYPVGPNLPRGADLVCDNYHILRAATLTTDLICICSTAFVADELRDGSLVAIEADLLPMTATEIFVGKLRGRAVSPLAASAITRVATFLSQV